MYLSVCNVFLFCPKQYTQISDVKVSVGEPIQRPLICFVRAQVKVMQKQLLLFHNAITAYFAGNQEQLETTLKQFNVRKTSEEKPSWLETET